MDFFSKILKTDTTSTFFMSFFGRLTLILYRKCLNFTKIKIRHDFPQKTCLFQKNEKIIHEAPYFSAKLRYIPQKTDLTTNFLLKNKFSNDFYKGLVYNVMRMILYKI